MRRIALLVVFALQACTSFEYVPPVGTHPKVSVDSPKGFDETWQAIIESFAETNTSIKTIEKVSGLVTAERMVPVSEIGAGYVDFGSISRVDVAPNLQKPPMHWRSWTSSLIFNVFLKKVEGDKCSLSVHTGWRGIVQHSSYNAWNGQTMVTAVNVDGISTGKFETELLTSILAKLGATNPNIVIVGGPVPREQKRGNFASNAADDYP